MDRSAGGWKIVGDRTERGRSKHSATRLKAEE